MQEDFMADYIQFTSDDGSSMLVEVEEGEIVSQKGVQKAGLREMVGKQVAEARTSFEDAIQQAIRYNAQTFMLAVHSLSALPDEAEITFGLKITGEAGNVAVGQVGGEVNYMIRLTWTRETQDKEQHEH